MITMRQSVFRVSRTLGLGAVALNLYEKYGYLFEYETRSRNARFIGQGAQDGLPIPPPKLIFKVTAQFDMDKFYQNGVEGAENIKEILAKNDLDINRFESILDFGCGCGRVLRQWKNLERSKIYGSDYNNLLVQWCQQSLKFAEVKLNGSDTRLDFEGGKFDFIYAISVFTHLTEESQLFWINELTRVLKPGGYLLITVSGTTRLDTLKPKERKVFESGHMVIVYPQHSGKNICNTFHPEEYIREKLCKNLKMIDFVPGGAKDANQDSCLLRKS